MSRRTERLASMIHRELSMVILRELNDPRLVGLPSITRVEVSEDISSADVYVTVMGSEGKQTAALNALKHSAGLMRSRLTKVMEIRQVPFLKFHLDEGLKKEMAILETLRLIELERQQQSGAPTLSDIAVSEAGAAGQPIEPQAPEAATGDKPADEPATEPADGPADGPSDKTADADNPENDR